MPSVNGKLLDIIYPNRIKPVPMPTKPSILDKQGKFKKGKKPKGWGIARKYKMKDSN